jgi:L-asparaginase II
MAALILPAGEYVVDVERSGVIESRHRGHLVVLGPDGAVERRIGDPEAAIFPRSTNKPLQAVGLHRLGVQLTEDQLALAAASHSGEPMHIAIVQAILARYSLDEAALRCPPALPADSAAAAAILRAGDDARRIYMTCSGKHSAMLATCVENGWPVASYLDAEHPLQRALAATVADLAGEPIAAIGVDGCGAPVFALSLSVLARCYLHLVTATAGAEFAVAGAVRGRPHLVAGSGRAATRLMAGYPGLLAKDGADGVFAAALPGVGALAVKIDDGSGPAAEVALAAGLQALGLSGPLLDELAAPPVLGGDRVVGHLHPAVALTG